MITTSNLLNRSYYVYDTNLGMNRVFLYLASGVIVGVLGGIFLVSFFYNPEKLFMVP